MLLAICLCCGNITEAQEIDGSGGNPEWGVEYTSELQLTHKGDFNWADLLYLQASLPVCNSLSFDVASISTYMTSKESIGEDLQTFSNLDAENIAFALAVCGVNWEIDKHNTLFAGVRNMNEDYFASPVTSFFANSSCGIFPTISCNYSIANYPLASVGVHYKYEKAFGTEEESNRDAIIIQGSIYNGVGYNRFVGRESVFRFCPNHDGIYGLAQIEYQHRGSSYFLGACGRYGNVPETDSRRFVTTLWAYAEHRLTDGLYLIADYSHSFAKPSVCSDFMGIGGKYSWGKSELGIFTDYARFSECGESATEISYKNQITSNIYIQPAAHIAVTDCTFQAAATLRFGVNL